MICRVCDASDLTQVLDLGMQPWCNDFLKKDMVGQEPFYPLILLYCNSCSTVQLNFTVPKEVMFGDHTYLSGVTTSLSAHFEAIAVESLSRFFPDRRAQEINVLDIGSNDGTQLAHFLRMGCEVLGVESSLTTANLAIEAGVPTLNRYFNNDLVLEMARKFEIINAAGVFFHLEELHSAAQGVKNALAEDGIFVVQFLYMKSIVDNLAFDQIYHEHLLYYNLKTIEILLNRHGLEMFDAYLAPIHGGSMIAFVTHKGLRDKSSRLTEMTDSEKRSGANELATYMEFAERIKTMKSDNLTYLKRAKEDGKRVYGMGAPVKGNTLLNYFGVGTDYLECLVEKNKLRDGLVSPGMHIPIVMEDENLEPPDIYYVLAWNFKEEILRNNQHLIDAGVEFYFPVNPKGSYS